MKKNKYAIFVGGETAGPIMPLLAVANAWKETNPHIEPVFVDIKQSVAARIVPLNDFQLKTIIAGKMRRYWSLQNMLSPLLILIGFIQALFFLHKMKPAVVVGAGGYVQVPVIFAAWLLRIPVVIHQQDIIPTFSNRICAPFAKKITTTFERSTKDFPEGAGFSKNYSEYTKAVWTGNPSDVQIPINKAQMEEQRNAALNIFKLDPEWPTVLVIGGGSGARGLNVALVKNLPGLLKIAQLVHSTGAGKKIEPPINMPVPYHDRYHQYEFINQIDKAFAIADIVITRAGISTLTALSALQKISIIIPMPDSHQEANAQYIYEHKAAITLDQSEIESDTFARIIKKALFDVKLQKQLKANIKALMPSDATTKMLHIIREVIHDK